jgi:hypothetical protein
MASQVLSGSSNPSYTNNTGQNVRILINYMANCTSMTWAGVTVTGSSAVVSKDTMEILGEFKSAVRTTTRPNVSEPNVTLTTGSVVASPPAPFNAGIFLSSEALVSLQTRTSVNSDIANLFYVPTAIRPGGTFPTEVILANGQSYSAVCSAYNIVVIREDGN